MKTKRRAIEPLILTSTKISMVGTSSYVLLFGICWINLQRLFFHVCMKGKWTESSKTETSLKMKIEGWGTVSGKSLEKTLTGFSFFWFLIHLWWILLSVCSINAFLMIRRKRIRKKWDVQRAVQAELIAEMIHMKHKCKSRRPYTEYDPNHCKFCMCLFLFLVSHIYCLRSPGFCIKFPEVHFAVSSLFALRHPNRRLLPNPFSIFQYYWYSKQNLRAN